MMMTITITLTLSSMDDEFGEDLGLSLDDVPDLVNFTLRHIRNIRKLLNLRYLAANRQNSYLYFPTKFFPIRAFVFRPEYQKVAQLVLSRARRDFREKQKKKRKKKKKPDEVTFVGIHNRRGDHIQYQKEVESIEKEINEINDFYIKQGLH